MEIGLAQGLAQSGQYDQQINDLRYREQALRQQEAQNEAKRRLFESDLDFQQGGNSFDQPLVKEVNKRIIQSIGDYVSDNPDWETNVNKRFYIKQLKNSLKDNPDVLRATATNDNRKALLQYAQEAKQKGVPFDEDALNEQLMRYQNYERFGNPDGEEAAKLNGLQAYTFSRPQDFIDSSATKLKLGNEFKDFDIVPTKFGGYYSKPKEAELDAIADNYIQQYRRQTMVEANKMGLKNMAEVKKWVKDGISAGIQKQFKLGDQLGYWEAGMRQKQMNAEAKEKAAKVQQGQYSPWHYFVDEKTNPAGTIAVDDVYKVWGSKHPIKAVGSDGSVADLSDFDFKPNGRYINQNGVTFIQGYVDLPLDVAEERGLYKQGPFTIDGVTAPYKDDVKETTILDKNGEEHKAIRVNYNLPVNRNDKVAMQKFNVMVDVDKLVQPTQSPQQQNFTGGGQKLMQDSQGNIFDVSSGQPVFVGRK